MDNGVEWRSVLSQEDVQRLIDLAVHEDVRGGDVTTEAIFQAPLRVHGHILARTATVCCGLPLALHILQRFDPQAHFHEEQPEGEALGPSSVLLRFDADVRAVLTAERTLLNFLMRLCGVAYAAHQAQAQLPKSGATRVYDTRKTVPGWRALDKAAVHVGGGANHRMGLYDAVLIKDNHIAAAGSVRRAVEMSRKHVGHGMIVQVEVDRLDQLEEALAAHPDIVLLDNFTDADLRTAVQQTAGRAELEASGGVTTARLAALAATGVQRISMGALTHSVVPADLSLEITA